MTKDIQQMKKGNNIAPIPFDRLISEGQSQKNRVLEEVMTQLFALLPTTAECQEAFVLSDGTKCWIKAFSPPSIRSNGELRYGFDVIFSQPHPLSHVEFTVKCSGWERSLNMG